MKYFDAKKQVHDSIRRYMNASLTGLVIPVSQPIVEIIIGEMFFHPELDEDKEESEPITKVDALKLLHVQQDGSQVAKTQSSRHPFCRSSSSRCGRASSLKMSWIRATA